MTGRQAALIVRTTLLVLDSRSMTVTPPLTEGTPQPICEDNPSTFARRVWRLAVLVHNFVAMLVTKC